MKPVIASFVLGFIFGAFIFACIGDESFKQGKEEGRALGHCDNVNGTMYMGKCVHITPAEMKDVN